MVGGAPVSVALFGYPGDWIRLPSTPRFWHHLIRFRHFIDGSLALASLDLACRDHVPTFPQRSPPSLLTTAACGGLRSAPDCRTRRALLHLSYSCASPCGRAMLVTQGPFAKPRHHLPEPCRRNRVAALGHENVPAVRIISSQCPQRSQFSIAEVMCRWIAILDPANANRLLREINLVPLQLDQLARPQPVSIGDQDRRGIAMPIATTLLGNRHQFLDLGLGQVFPPTPRANCLTFRHGSLKLDHDFSPILPSLAHSQCYTFQKRDSHSSQARPGSDRGPLRKASPP
jgi:hypothetical protein